MAKLFNRAKVNTATTGTGTVTLGAAVSTAFCTFAEAGVANGNVVAYVIEDSNDFEIGIGTYTSSGTTLSRDTVRLSKIGGTAGTSKINLSGSAVVYLSPAKEDMLSMSEAARRTITGADTVVAADHGHVVEATSGTFTLAFTAAAAMGAGFQCVIYNSGTGDVTLDPNSSEQIDGLTSWVLYPGGAILVTCTGSAFESVLLAPMRVQFDSSGTFTKPGVGTWCRVEGWGGGGSGGRGRAAAVAVGGGGGGGGAYNTKLMPLSSLGATETVTVGAGGAAQTADSTAGSVGGTTTFGSLLSVYGGGGGGGGSGAGSGSGSGGGGGVFGAGSSGAATSAGDGGTPRLTFLADGASPMGTAGSDNIFGGGGGAGNSGAGFSSACGGGGGGGGAAGASAAGAGGVTVYGGGGGGGAAVSGSGGAAGTSIGGGAGGAGVNGANAGNSGAQPGGGGSGSQNANSGAGAGGRLIVYIW